MICVKVTGVNPPEFLTFKGLRLKCQQGALNYVKRNPFALIFMDYCHIGFTCPDFYTELLLDLPFKTLLEAFALFLFASGKFPVSWKVAVFWSLGDKQFSVFSN